MNKNLNTMDAQTLMNTPMEPLKFIIEDFLPQGLSILAGSPKIGKSWFSLWLCLQVAEGKNVWDFETRKSDVLYLCLEDSFARIQNRLFKITEDAPPSLHFAVISNKLKAGLETQIENFISSHENTKFIVIDTLQKVRDNSSSASSMYGRDYEDIDILKNLADKFQISILLIHHLRKANDNDPINMISGSTGITGSADTNFVLQKDKRIGNIAKLVCVGRDIEGREIPLEFNKELYIWEPLSEIELEKITVPNEIFVLCDYIKSVVNFTGISSELLEKIKNILPTEYNASSFKKKIIKHFDVLVKNGISYKDDRSFKRREFTLSYDTMTDLTLKTTTPPCQEYVS